MHGIMELFKTHCGNSVGIMRGDIGAGWTGSDEFSVKIALELALGG